MGIHHRYLCGSGFLGSCRYVVAGQENGAGVPDNAKGSPAGPGGGGNGDGEELCLLRCQKGCR